MAQKMIQGKKQVCTEKTSKCTAGIMCQYLKISKQTAPKTSNNGIIMFIFEGS